MTTVLPSGLMKASPTSSPVGNRERRCRMLSKTISVLIFGGAAGAVVEAGTVVVAGAGAGGAPSGGGGGRGGGGGGGGVGAAPLLGRGSPELILTEFRGLEQQIDARELRHFGPL